MKIKDVLTKLSGLDPNDEDTMTKKMTKTKTKMAKNRFNPLTFSGKRTKPIDDTAVGKNKPKARTYLLKDISDLKLKTI